MPGTLHIPTYHNKDFAVLVASMLPMSILLNYFLYGNRLFSQNGLLVWGTLLTFVVLGFAFLTYGFVAISLRNRFPGDHEFLKRLGICLSIFFLMSAVYISLILRSFDYFN